MLNDRVSTSDLPRYQSPAFKKHDPVRVVQGSGSNSSLYYSSLYYSGLYYVSLYYISLYR